MILKTKKVTRLEIQHRATGKAARALRLKHGLSLRETARAMGISAPYLCDLEHGRRNWNKKLAAEFELAVRE